MPSGGALPGLGKSDTRGVLVISLVADRDEKSEAEAGESRRSRRADLAARARQVGPEQARPHPVRGRDPGQGGRGCGRRRRSEGGLSAAWWTHDFEFLDLRPRSWADAFPWIPGKAADRGLGAGQWWDWSIDDSMSRLATRSWATSSRSRSIGWASGQSATSSRASQATFELATLDLPVRAKNVLYREQIHTGADVAELSGRSSARVSQRWRWNRDGDPPRVSRGLHVAGPGHGFRERAICRRNVERGRGAQSLARRVCVQDLETLAEWHHSLGLGDRGVLSELPLGAPEAVVAGAEASAEAECRRCSAKQRGERG